MTTGKMLKFKQQEKEGLKDIRIVLAVATSSLVKSQILHNALELVTIKYQEDNINWKEDPFGIFLDKIAFPELYFEVIRLDNDIKKILEPINRIVETNSSEEGHSLELISILDKNIQTDFKGTFIYFNEDTIPDRNYDYEDGIKLFRDFYDQIKKQKAA